MNRKSLIATVKSQCADSIRIGSLPDGKKCEYVEIFNDLNGNGSFGVTLNGNWCAINDDRIKEVVGSDHQRIMFRLLEYKLEDVVIRIKKGLASHNLPASMILTFPFDEILIGSINSTWKNLALAWIEQGYPVNDEIRLVICDNDKQHPLWLKAHKQRLSNVLNI